MAEYVTIGEALPSQVDGLDVLGAVCNNMVVPLAAPHFADPELQPLTRADDYGFEIYRSSLVFLLAKCAEELAHGSEFRVRQSISQARGPRLRAARPRRRATSRASPPRLKS